MKRTLLFAIALAMTVAAPTLTPAFAEEATLTGEPVDIACYSSGRSGEGHAACATACAERGQPIGFKVEADGETSLYLVLGANGKPAKDYMAKHMGKQVEVTGEVSESNGMKILKVTAVSE